MEHRPRVVRTGEHKGNRAWSRCPREHFMTWLLCLRNTNIRTLAVQLPTVAPVPPDASHLLAQKAAVPSGDQPAPGAISRASTPES